MKRKKYLKNNLKKLRLNVSKKGEKQDSFYFELAKELDTLLKKDTDYNPETLISYERQRRDLPLNIAIELSKKYNVTLDWLYCLENEMKNDTMEQIMLGLRKIISIGKIMEDNEKLRTVFLINEDFLEYLSKVRNIENLFRVENLFDLEQYNNARRKVFDEYGPLLAKLDENATFVTEDRLSVYGIKSTTVTNESDTILTYFTDQDW